MMDVTAQISRRLEAFWGYKHVLCTDTLQHAYELILNQFTTKEHALFCSANQNIELYKAINCAPCTPHYYDLRLDGTLDIKQLQKQLTDQSTLLFSHYYGALSDHTACEVLAQEYALTLLEDATNTFYRPIKSKAVATLFSLESLIEGEKAAFIATDSDEIAQQLQHQIKGGYIQKKNYNYDIDLSTPNIELSPLLAKMILEHLEHLELRRSLITQHQKVYYEKLKHSRLITLPPQEHLTPSRTFAIALVPALFCPKEEIYNALKERGIDVKVGYKPIYKNSAFLDTHCSLFGTEELYKSELLLPCDDYLSTEEIAHYAELLLEILSQFNYRGCSF